MKRSHVVGLAVEGPERHPWSAGRWIWELLSLAAIIGALLLVVYGLDGFLPGIGGGP